MAKVNVIFYSAYGHIYRMAEAEAEGAREVAGTEVKVYQVPETLSEDIQKKMHAFDARKAFAHIPVAVPETLAECDAAILGTPTRYGNMCGQMRCYLDAMGALWSKDTFVGKLASAFSSSNTQHGGQETTIITTYVTLFHLGFIVVGLPYAADGQRTDTEISGGSPYGASTIAGREGRRMPSENELMLARWQGRHVAETARKLFG